MFKWIKNKLGALMFGLKGADEVIMGQSDPFEGGLVIQKEVHDKRVSKHLLKGEITQEVEELRWRNYAVAKESKNYKYTGDGKARYVQKKSTGSDGVVSLFQENKPNIENVLDGMKQVENGISTKDTYTLVLTYDGIPRFRIEPNVNAFKLVIKPTKRRIDLYVDTLPNSNDPRSKPFLNELEKLYQYQGEYFNQKCEISSSVTGIAFVTDKAQGEDDLISYILSQMSFIEVKKEEERYVISYSFDFYLRENLLDKFYNKEMAEKYEKKMPKDLEFTIFDPSMTDKCSDCGAEVPKLDAFVTEEQFGRVLCQKCFENRLKNGKLD